MYHFFQSCINSVIPLSIFLKSCTTIKKLYSQRKKAVQHWNTCAFVLNSFAMVFVTKCTIFPKLYKFCHPHINIFTKAVQPKKNLHSFGTLALVLNSFPMAFAPKCTIFPNLYKFRHPHINIFEKLYND